MVINLQSSPMPICQEMATMLLFEHTPPLCVALIFVLCTKHLSACKLSVRCSQMMKYRSL